MLLPDLDYKVVDGKITTRSIEVHIVDHCNLSCAECCSLSPLLPENFTPPEEMENDLRLVGRVISPTYLKLVGGEPLLHPELLRCIDIAKNLNIAQIVSVTTNALLIEKMNDDFWRAVDALTISVYPKPKIDTRLMSYINEKADKFNVSLNIKIQNDFVKMTHFSESDDFQGKKEIFSECWLRERCHIVHKGRFYMCTRPPHFHTLYKGSKPFCGDGVVLHNGETMLSEIYNYLICSTPLLACSYCNGGNGETIPHRRMNKKEIENVLKDIG